MDLFRSEWPAFAFLTWGQVDGLLAVLSVVTVLVGRRRETPLPQGEEGV
jgi:hypothetical protein